MKPFHDKGDYYDNADNSVICAACSTRQKMYPIDDHACISCRRVLNGSGRHLVQVLPNVEVK